MKKFIAFVLSALTVFTMSGCMVTIGLFGQ